MSQSSPSELANLIETVRKLRAPDGCPWDRAQTHQSIRQYLIEEAYEVLDVLDQIDSPVALKDEKLKYVFREELGDLLLQVLLHAQMADEAGFFNFEGVAAALNEKLIRRHPHVFGEAAKADSEESAFQSWEKTKAKEKAANPRASVLDGVPKGLPLLQRAARVMEKVTKVGFQWKDLKGPLDKIDEELREFKTEILECEKLNEQVSAEAQDKVRKKAEHELGDVFFSLCNVAYLTKLNPEDAFRTTLKRFETRFKHVELRLKEQGRTPDQSTLEEMDRYWDEAKLLEKKK
ncbi:MAG TPA: nucleoside triphosphate pyrophosphohydrolase [Bdellovibrionales bacterium]|nr:MAG: nucleoside triphosphate pyrophosphohydrolase [Bdellovibrionales bacterium GWA1_52_35]HAR43991.1 nucleoside triphosphate pyrophosphohydrolase [Bdellovibrionales bacterium]HCM39632.1 nucleoside triphosphate pyrophosphohydrolase [Bdellovibrionales bacterium]